ncbi:MAG: hypothetical protein GWP39_05395, partial [Planctomycetia bacterium]|nr:hypothetical protein [Planctomycetia bacterium]
LLRALAKEIDGSGVDNVRLLISEGADVNYRGNQNWTPVLIASRYSYPEIVELLLEEGAEVNVSNNFGMTPLMFAAKYSSTPEIVQMLLEKGAEVNVRSPDGMTPLKFAKTPEIKHLLIDAGAKE